MPIEIERGPRPCRPEMPHSPQHFQVAQIIEPITGINKRCPAQLCFLSQELYGSQCPYSPLSLTPLLSLSFFLHLRLQGCPDYLHRLLILPGLPPHQAGIYPESARYVHNPE